MAWTRTYPSTSLSTVVAPPRHARRARRLALVPPAPLGLAGVHLRPGCRPSWLARFGGLPVIEGGSMDRRTMLRATVVGAGAVALPFTAWSAAYARTGAERGRPVRPAAGGRRPRHPAARRLHQPRSSPGPARWCPAPRTSGTTPPTAARSFANGTGWIYVSNSETSAGVRRRRVADPVQRQRRDRRRVPDPVRHQQQLRRRQDAVEHLAVLRGGQPRPGLGDVPARRHGRGAARRWAGSSTRRPPPTRSGRSST